MRISWIETYNYWKYVLFQAQITINFMQGMRSFGCTFLWDLLQEREDDDLLDTFALTQQHHQSIDPQSPPCTWHQSVLQRLHKVSIPWSISTLDSRIVQLSVAVRELPPADEELETGCEVRSILQRLGQGGEDTWVVHEEKGTVEAQRLEKVSGQLIEHSNLYFKYLSAVRGSSQATLCLAIKFFKKNNDSLL
jgi:hypothetical protein